MACGTVVFKTRARRLYDIANALAALGLVRKVRSVTQSQITAGYLAGKRETPR